MIGYISPVSFKPCIHSQVLETRRRCNLCFISIRASTYNDSEGLLCMYVIEHKINTSTDWAPL